MALFKKARLEKQFVEEIKYYAGVKDFPLEDAEVISKLMTAYSRGSSFVMLEMMTAIDTLDKYPNLVENWDELIMKYQEFGLFPKS